MNQRATASVNALIKALPFGAPDDLLLLSIFGSQVKGTERPDSDLDVLYVTRTSKILPINTISNAITKTPGGVTKATIIPHGPDTITRTANVYGSVEYGVLREQCAKTLWRAAGFNVKLHPDIDYDYSAGRWLDMAKNIIFPEECLESRPASTCFWMHMAISNMLKAGLISARIKFPFTRDVRVLYGMLPAERRPPLDVEAAAAILERCDKDDKNWSRADVRAATHMAKQVYRFTNKTIKPVGRSEDRPTITPRVHTPAGSPNTCG